MRRQGPRDRWTRIVLAVLCAAIVWTGAACGDDDDDASTDTTEAGGATAEGEGNVEDGEPSEALSPDEAREAGNPETYARIEGLEDCGELERERDAARTNAENRADDPERQSILEAYATAAEERMSELDC